MKFRQHRGSLSDSMATCVDIEPTKEALNKHVGDLLKGWPVTRPLSLHIEHYCYDERIQWDTFIVTAVGWGVIGFTNQLPT